MTRMPCVYSIKLMCYRSILMACVKICLPYFPLPPQKCENNLGEKRENKICIYSLIIYSLPCVSFSSRVLQGDMSESCLTFTDF